MSFRQPTFLWTSSHAAIPVATSQYGRRGNAVFQCHRSASSAAPKSNVGGLGSPEAPDGFQLVAGGASRHVKVRPFRAHRCLANLIFLYIATPTQFALDMKINSERTL